VLTAAPGSRLILKARQLGDEEVVAFLRQRLAMAGIAGEAVVCEGPVARADYLARYRDLDLVLDSTPVGGGTTTIEAMWMGVPSVRIAGDRMAGRLGETFMRAAGLDEFVCSDDDAYVACAIGWAGRRADLAALRATLRQRLFASAAGNVGAFARDLEACLRGMWRERCAAG
jgi:predicted O-linked N-acetylglucosamine transferase (SPINDLY family)